MLLELIKVTSVYEDSKVLLSNVYAILGGYWAFLRILVLLRIAGILGEDVCYWESVFY